MLKNTSSTYGMVAKSFHWLMAALLIGMFIIAYIMTNMDKSPLRWSLYDIHKATGLLLFALFAMRLSWRMLNEQPTLSHIPKWQRQAAKINILFLYLLMCVMPITGFLTSTLGGHDITFYGLFTITPFANNETASDFFGEAHEIISYLLIAAFSLHVVGALYHHFFLKDEVLKRMWREKKVGA